MSWVRDRHKREAEERARLRSSVLLSVAALTGLVILGTVVMRLLEGWNWITAFYFSVTTLTTVGYGDHYPTHDASRLFVAFYVIAGVTTALSAMTVVGRNYLEFIERRLMRDRWRMRRSTHQGHHPHGTHRDQSSP